jgi:hypothetical protein
MERDLTHDEIVTKMDLGNGYNCLCGEMFESDDENPVCAKCGRKYHLVFGIVGGEVEEKELD